MKGKKKSLLKNKSFVSFLATFPHVCSTRNSSRVAVRRPKRGHNKTRSEGVAKDIEVLRMQILFAHCPMPLPIEFVVLVCVFLCDYLVILMYLVPDGKRLE